MIKPKTNPINNNSPKTSADSKLLVCKLNPTSPTLIIKKKIPKDHEGEGICEYELTIKSDQLFVQPSHFVANLITE